jgi:hypothetical protein
MTHAAKVLFALSLTIVLAGGCGESSMAGDRDVVVIRAERLPAGWQLVPSSEMPPSDKMPWWRENPQTLSDPLPQEFVPLAGRATTAVRARAALYGNGADRVAILAWSFNTRADMENECQIYRQQGVEPEGFLGIARRETNTVVFMSLRPGLPDQGFFVARFRALVDEGY